MNKSIQEPKSNSVSIFLLFWLFFIPFTLSAQENDKYTMIKPLTWDELQLYQLDILKTADELKLATACPSTLKKLQNDLNFNSIHMQHILGTNYIWTEFENSDGLLCIVKHKNINTLMNNKESFKSFINPNDYRLLDLTQMRVLKSASLGGGDTEKERFRNNLIMEINRKNQAIQNKPYVKYGGIENLFNYMAKNKPNCITQKVNLIPRTYVTAYGSHTGKLNSPIDNFENKYCESQINELLESVKINKTNNQ